MIGWLLQQLERLPSASFSERELRLWDADGFARLRDEHLLRRCPSPETGDSVFDATGRMVTLIEGPDGSLLAFDDDDADGSLWELDPDLLASWRVNWDAVSARFRGDNRLTKPASQLDPRLQLLGSADRGTAVLLALLPDRSVAEQLLAGVPNFLPPVYGSFLVLTPSFLPSPRLARALALLNLHCEQLDTTRPFLIPAAGFSALRRIATPRRESQQRLPSGFTYEHDFRLVHWQGEQFALTLMEAAVIEVLWQAFQQGRPELRPAKLLEEVGSKSRRLHDLFKRHKRALSCLIRSGEHGTVRLNVDD